MATATKATNKREAVMRAALDLFVERGFYGTAVPEIADKAEVGAGTIYRYFPSKEALVNELYREEKMRFGNSVIDHFPTGNARELFRTLWMRMAKFAVENEKSFVFLELHHHARYLDAESRAVEKRMTASVHERDHRGTGARRAQGWLPPAVHGHRDGRVHRRDPQLRRGRPRGGRRRLEARRAVRVGSHPRLT